MVYTTLYIRIFEYPDLKVPVLYIGELEGSK